MAIKHRVLVIFKYDWSSSTGFIAESKSQERPSMIMITDPLQSQDLSQGRKTPGVGNLI
jgi:hypothetical protein